MASNDIFLDVDAEESDDAADTAGKAELDGRDDTNHDNAAPAALSAAQSTYARGAMTGPIDANLQSKCSVKSCELLSGSANDWDIAFHDKIKERFKAGVRVRQFWFEPDIPGAVGLRQCIHIAALCTKRVFVWRPDLQFGQRLELPCKACAVVGRPSPMRKFVCAGWLGARYVHTMEGGAYLLTCRYKCSHFDKCRNRISATHPDFLATLPAPMRAYFPFLLTSKSGFQKTWLSLLFMLWSAGQPLGKLQSTIARWRHARYLERRELYYMSRMDMLLHKKQRGDEAELKSQRSIHEFTAPSTSGPVPVFPPFGRHCEGYNEILAPAGDTLMEAIRDYAAQLEVVEYADRFMCSLTGVAVSSDQHYKVPARIRAIDPATATNPQLVEGLMGTMNERSQILDYFWTASSSHAELESTVQAIKDRDPQHPPTMWTTDRCCVV
jgi:hypothetical protein